MASTFSEAELGWGIGIATAAGLTFGVCQLSWLESERSLSYAGNLAAVENVRLFDRPRTAASLYI